MLLVSHAVFFSLSQLIISHGNCRFALLSNNHVIVCGSRNEVANDPSLGDFGFEIIQYFQNVDINPAAHRESVFFMIALEARDQLRQLMALQLSQLFAIVPLVLTGGWDHTENFLNFYDSECLGRVEIRDMMVNEGIVLSYFLTKQHTFSYFPQFS